MQKTKEVARAGKRMGKKVMATDTAQDVVEVLVDGLEEVVVDKADDAGDALKVRAARAGGRAPKPTTAKKSTAKKSTSSQEVDGQEVDGQEVDGQEVDGQEVDGQEVDGQEVDGQEVDGQEVDGQEVDGGDVEGAATLIALCGRPGRLTLGQLRSLIRGGRDSTLHWKLLASDNQKDGIGPRLDGDDLP